MTNSELSLDAKLLAKKKPTRFDIIIFQNVISNSAQIDNKIYCSHLGPVKSVIRLQSGYLGLGLKTC